MREIKLTRGLVALVDDEDFEELNNYRWNVKYHGKTIYTKRAEKKNGSYHTLYLHQQILGKAPEKMEIDHRDGNGLNNQRYNLRFVTHRVNGQNRKNESTTSRYPGVSWSKVVQKWHAYITINKVRKHLGYFTDEEEAYRVYQKAVQETENPFASLSINELMIKITKIKQKEVKLNGSTL